LTPYRETGVGARGGAKLAIHAAPTKAASFAAVALMLTTFFARDVAQRRDLS